MKYRQLTKEQLTELHSEFAQFLATQQIDKKEWEVMKTEKPDLVIEEINIFSDLVWEDVLTKTLFLEHISEKNINLFRANKTNLDRIYVQLNNTDKSFLNVEDFKWFTNNPLHDEISYFKGTKNYELPRNEELFKLIEMGSQISDGKLFKNLNQLIE